jgi:hypothetical protein
MLNRDQGIQSQLQVYFVCFIMPSLKSVLATEAWFAHSVIWVQ